MKRYSRPELELKEESAIKSTPFPQRQILSPKTPINPIILQQEGESESGGQQDGKFSMEQLCKVFMERIGDRTNCQIEAKQLIELTGVKQRRIYDLMNILEGCGFTKRISKGKYVWFGFQESNFKKIQKEGRKKEATSLSNLAARVKYLLFHAEDYIDFKIICQQILQENGHHGFNPDSIKRRVYECCKILKIMGLIDKKEHTFKWITQEDRQKTHIKGEYIGKGKLLKIQSYNSAETYKKARNMQISQQQYLISELVKTVNTEQELENLLNKIKNEFAKNIGEKMKMGINPLKLFSDI